MSPFIHKRLFEMRDIDADYGVYDIPTEDLIGKNPGAEVSRWL